jgi:hypothetical protein
MSSGGAVTLGELADRLPMLEVACSRCERRGRLNVAKLIERHGPDTRLPDLREILAGDCPRSSAVAIHERCGVHYLPAALLIGMSKICRSIAHSCSQRSSNPQIG